MKRMTGTTTTTPRKRKKNRRKMKMMSNSDHRVLLNFAADTGIVEKPSATFDEVLKEASTFKNMLDRKAQLIATINACERELDFLIPEIEKKKEKMRGLLCIR